MRQVFVSYSLTDWEYVDRLVAHWRSRGVSTWSQGGVDFGAKWREVIDAELASSAAMVFVSSGRSATALWAEREIFLARQMGIPVYLVELGPDHDFRRFYEATFNATGGEVPEPDLLLSAAVRDQVSSSTNSATSGAPSTPNATLTLRRALNCEGAVRTVDWSSLTDSIAVGTYLGTVELWGAESQRSIAAQVHDGWVWKVRVSPDGAQVASVGHDCRVQVTDRSGQSHELLRSPDWLWGLDWSPTGETIVVAGYSGRLAVLNAVDASLNWSIDRDEWIWCCAWSPDGRHIAFGDATGRIQVLSAETHQVIAEFLGHSGGVFDLHWSPDGERLVSGGHDTTVRVWEVASAFSRQVLTGHSSWVNSVAWHPSGRFIASTGSDGGLYIWYANIDRFLATKIPLMGRATGLSWSPSGQQLAVTQHAMVFIFEFSHG